MRNAFTALVASAVSLAGCASMSMPTGTDMTPEDRAGYTAMAAASDQFEIQSSQIALSKAQNPQVRQFAQMLITHHMQTTAALTAAAAASGMSPPAPMLMPMQRQMIDELQATSSGSFDRVFLQQQVPAHEMALALHQNYAARGDATPLRTAAAAAVPIVQQHLAQARQLD
jgi:putative membrane protein